MLRLLLSDFDGTAVVTAVVLIRCDYGCGERCGPCLRRWVIRRVSRRLPRSALRQRLLCVPGRLQLSGARGPPPGCQWSVRPCLRMTWPRGPDRLRTNSRGSRRAVTKQLPRYLQPLLPPARKRLPLLIRKLISTSSFASSCENQLWSGSLPRRRRRSGLATTKDTTYNRNGYMEQDVHSLAAVDNSRAYPPEPRGLSRRHAVIRGGGHPRDSQRRTQVSVLQLL